MHGESISCGTDLITMLAIKPRALEMLGFYVVSHIGCLFRRIFTQHAMPQTIRTPFHVLWKHTIHFYKLKIPLLWLINCDQQIWADCLCFLKKCIERAFLVGQTLEQSSQGKPAPWKCFDSMWFLTWDVFLDEKSHIRQCQFPSSLFSIFKEITASNSKKVIKDD